MRAPDWARLNFENCRLAGQIDFWQVVYAQSNIHIHSICTFILKHICEAGVGRALAWYLEEEFALFAFGEVRAQLFRECLGERCEYED